MVVAEHAPTSANGAAPDRLTTGQAGSRYLAVAFLAATPALLDALHQARAGGGLWPAMLPTAAAAIYGATVAAPPTLQHNP